MYRNADGTNKTNKQRREEKRREAVQRAAAREARTDEEQLMVLQARGQGMCGEAMTLRNRIEAD